MLTTIRLLRNAFEAVFILSDATYKLTYGGFPALTGGKTDKNKNFHPFGIAFNPSILVADNADAVTLGFKKVFDMKKEYIVGLM